jgi:hypothetical protein
MLYKDHSNVTLSLSIQTANQAISIMMEAAITRPPFKKIPACCLHPPLPRKIANKRRKRSDEKKMPRLAPEIPTSPS